MKELLMTLATAYRLRGLVFALAALACACEPPSKDSLEALPPTWLPPQGAVERVFETNDFQFVSFSGTEKDFHGLRPKEVLYWFEDGDPRLVVAYFADSTVDKVVLACAKEFGRTLYVRREIDGRLMSVHALWENPSQDVRYIEIEKLGDGSSYPRPSELGIGGDDEFHILEIRIRAH